MAEALFEGEDVWVEGGIGGYQSSKDKQEEEEEEWPEEYGGWRCDAPDY